MRRLLAYAAIYLLWGATYLAVRTVVLVTPPFAAAAVRFLLSGSLLYILSGRRGDPWPTRMEWVNSAKLGFVMFAINYACFFWAERRLYSGIAAVVVSTMPVWVLAAEWIASRLEGRARTLTAASLVGSALGIGGVALVARSGGGPAASSHHVTTVAILVLLAGTIAWSSGSVWSWSLNLPARQPVRSALQMMTGGLFLLVLALLTGEARPAARALAAWGWVTWLCFAYLIMASIVAYTSYVWLLEREPASRVASYAYVNPLVALSLGVGIGHEHVSRWQVAGGAMVLLGVFAALRSRPAPPVGYASEETS